MTAWMWGGFRAGVQEERGDVTGRAGVWMWRAPWVVAGQTGQVTWEAPVRLLAGGCGAVEGYGCCCGAAASEGRVPGATARTKEQTIEGEGPRFWSEKVQDSSMTGGALAPSLRVSSGEADGGPGRGDEHPRVLWVLLMPGVSLPATPVWPISMSCRSVRNTAPRAPCSDEWAGPGICILWSLSGHCLVLPEPSFSRPARRGCGAPR